MSKKLWQNMNLTEKTQAYNKMKDRFPDGGVTSTSESKIMQLCEMNIPADNDAIRAVIRGETSIDKIRLAVTPVKPITETADESDKDWYHFL